MTAYEQIQRDFSLLSSFTRSKSRALLSSPELVLLAREFGENYSPALERELRAKLQGAYTANAEHLKQMAQKAGGLGRFHSLWLGKELELAGMEKVLNTESAPRSKEFSRLFNKRRMEASISQEARRTLVMLQNGFTMEEIARGNRGMNNQSERIWRTESHQMYSQSVANSMKHTGMRLQAVEVIDGKTREQSHFVNGTLSDEQGKFLYPDGGRYVLGNSGQARWDINDRGIAVPYGGQDIKTLEVGRDIPPPRSLAMELAGNLILSYAMQELFSIVFGVK